MIVFKCVCIIFNDKWISILFLTFLFVFFFLHDLYICSTPFCLKPFTLKYYRCTGQTWKQLMKYNVEFIHLNISHYPIYANVKMNQILFNFELNFPEFKIDFSLGLRFCTFWWKSIEFSIVFSLFISQSSNKGAHFRTICWEDKHWCVHFGSPVPHILLQKRENDFLCFVCVCVFKMLNELRCINSVPVWAYYGISFDNLLSSAIVILLI